MDALNHPYPGITLQEEVIEPLHLTVSDAAEKLGVSRNAFSRMLSDKSVMACTSAPSRRTRNFFVTFEKLILKSLGSSMVIIESQDYLLDIHVQYIAHESKHQPIRDDAQQADQNHAGNDEGRVHGFPGLQQQGAQP